ncbi:MAG: helix-turn-helix transcriptional regulator [Acidaminococcaceae bacterium]|nr:helix-turn-helix transcriptional regulator [Acidaminococcaceae bacterium]MBQ9634651.1 helix-turn-helix transcriptional regulator [Acidaminococcaceae bacterium]
MKKYDVNVRAYSSKKIREYRKLMGWTQKDLGDRLGVKFNTVSGWENGVSEPLQDQLFMMASLFGISINDLFPPTVISNHLLDIEKDLLTDFRKLNPAGQTVAAATVKGFTQMPQYTEPEEPALKKGTA